VVTKQDFINTLFTCASAVAFGKPLLYERLRQRVYVIP